MRIIYDAMGGDNAPHEIIKGGLISEKEFGIEPVFVGNEDIVKNELINQGADPSKYEIIKSQSVIENDEEPAFAIRKKRDSSIVIGLNSLSSGDYDGFISCGNTGALLAGGLFIVKRIDKVKRSPIAAMIPTKTDPILLIDAGANVDISSDILAQFAILGDAYVSNVFGIKNPRIGILNIGTEEGKGNNLTKETYELLKNREDINFVGNVEANTVPFGGVDVLIADGFAGNILLKTYEGAADMISSIIYGTIKNIEDMEFLAKFKKYFEESIAFFDYAEYGGAPLLGLNKPIFKAHGKSTAKDLVGGTSQLVKFIENDVTSIMKNHIAKDD